MDYCSSCRRHLNGALVCPGCGAYAPDIAPPVTVRRIGSVSEAADAGAAASCAVAVVPAPVPGDDVEELVPARQGRAARRRQLARWKKHKRRAAVASAFALVGGGLTVAMMDRHSTDRAQAATVPDHRGTGAVEERIPEQNPTESDPSTTPITPTTPTTPSRSRSQSQPPSAGAPREQSFAASSRTSRSVAEPDAAASATPTPAAPSVPEQRSTAPSAADSAAERSGTATEQPAGQPSEQPTAPANADGTDSDTSRTVPALISTSPTEVCVLMVCLG